MLSFKSCVAGLAFAAQLGACNLSFDASVEPPAPEFQAGDSQQCHDQIGYAYMKVMRSYDTMIKDQEKLKNAYLDLLFYQVVTDIQIDNNQEFLDWTMRDWEETEIYKEYGYPKPGFSQEVLDMFVPSEPREPIQRREPLIEAMDVLIPYLQHWRLLDSVETAEGWEDLDISACEGQTAQLGKIYQDWSRQLTGPNEYVEWLERG